MQVAHRGPCKHWTDTLRHTKYRRCRCTGWSEKSSSHTELSTDSNFRQVWVSM